MRCFLLTALVVLLLALPPHASAQEGLATGTAPAPIAGADAVAFISQALDARLLRAADGSYNAEVESVIRLHNTDRFNDTTVTLGWPGWPGGELRFDPDALAGFAVSNEAQPLALQRETRTTVWGGEARDSEWVVAQAPIPRDTRERLFINWSQPLGQGPLLTFSFGLVPAGAWSGPVGSVRVSLALPSFASQELIVRAVPETFTFTGSGIEWILVEEEPATNLSVTFVAPHVWAEIEAARAARANDPVGSALRLADLYEALAAAGATGYGAEAEAVLEEGRRAAPDNPELLRRLALLYRTRAASGGRGLAAAGAGGGSGGSGSGGGCGRSGPARVAAAGP